MRLRVLYHGNCFDGCSSAGVFTRFYRRADCQRALLTLSTGRSSTRGSAQPFAADFFDGDENACVDFRYSQDPRLTWWFDHHASAFQLPGDEDHFRADATGRKFYDPKAKSCTKFLADTVAAKFGFDAAPLAELIHWAEIIDGALFPDAKMAVELKEPALQLMTFIENNRDPALADRFIGDLISRPLAEIAADPYVARPLGAAARAAPAQHRDDAGGRASSKAGVVFFDLTDEASALQQVHLVLPVPRGRATRSGSPRRRAQRSPSARTPGRKEPRTHDITKICERYGGGGHPVVGAISIPRGELARAREIARDVVAELQG